MSKFMITDIFEKEQWDKDKLLYGVDEAGMGCLAGAMFVGGVAFPQNYDFSIKLSALNDSKKLTEKKRYELEPLIKQDAIGYFCIEIPPEMVDDVSAYHARLIAAANAFKKIELEKTYHVLMDGNVKIETEPGVESSCLIKGDSKSYTLAAASILAKCAKDREMIELDKIHPEYRWAKNKGYGTKEHDSAIEKYGLTRYHRRTYCKKFIKEK